MRVLKLRKSHSSTIDNNERVYSGLNYIYNKLNCSSQTSSPFTNYLTFLTCLWSWERKTGVGTGDGAEVLYLYIQARLRT